MFNEYEVYQLMKLHQEEVERKAQSTKCLENGRSPKGHIISKAS
jgi:hypothetical protein